MEPQPLVSVLIAAYNVAPYIGESVHSVLRQDYPNLEVIVVDDGSIDRTWDVLKGIGDSRLFPIRLKKNKGVSHARNVAAETCRGDFTLIFDGDDILCDKSLRNLALRLSADESAAGVYGFVEANIDARGKKTNPPLREFIYEHRAFGEKFKKVDRRILSEIYLASTFSPLMLQTLLFRRKLGDRAGWFDANLRLREDIDFLIRLSKFGDFAYVPKPVLRYRLRSDCASVILPNADPDHYRLSARKIRNRLVKKHARRP